MSAIIEACVAPDYPGEVAVVISNRPDAAGLEIARAAGVRAEVTDHKTFENREEFEEAMNVILDEAGVEILLNAGFMRITTECFVVKWLGRQINIHPSLLPSFGGLKVHEQVLKADVRVSGCTVHFVTNVLDGGPIIGQARVPVLHDDTVETLGARVLAREHELFPRCVRMLAEGKVRYEDNKAVFADGAGALGILI